MALTLEDGRTLVVHDTGRGDALTVLWHHGSPQTGALLEPLVRAAAGRDIRLLSYGRPSYGGSTKQPDRTVADAAYDVEELANQLGIATFATMGASGGGPHALACAALLPQTRDCRRVDLRPRPTHATVRLVPAEWSPPRG